MPMGCYPFFNTSSRGRIQASIGKFWHSNFRSRQIGRINSNLVGRTLVETIFFRPGSQVGRHSVNLGRFKAFSRGRKAYSSGPFGWAQGFTLFPKRLGTGWRKPGEGFGLFPPRETIFPRIQVPGLPSYWLGLQFWSQLGFRECFRAKKIFRPGGNSRLHSEKFGLGPEF